MQDGNREKIISSEGMLVCSDVSRCTVFVWHGRFMVSLVRFNRSFSGMM